MERTAVATWQGAGKDGIGALSTASRALEALPYSYATRFESAPGTNPEELIAAAHAACFAMKLSFVLAEAGFKSEKLNVHATVAFDGKAVTHSHLTVRGNVPGITAEQFAACANDAKANCPISKSLVAQVSLEAVLDAGTTASRA
jgi:osmotically inducible protein OsmC